MTLRRIHDTPDGRMFGFNNKSKRLAVKVLNYKKPKMIFNAQGNHKGIQVLKINLVEVLSSMQNNGARKMDHAIDMK